MNQPPRERLKGPLSHLKELNMTKVRSSDISTECPHPQELSKALSGAGMGVVRELQGAKGKDFPGKGMAVKREERFWDDKEPFC